MVDAGIDAKGDEKVRDALCKPLLREGNLEVEIARGVGDKAPRHERTAHERLPAAASGHELDRNPRLLTVTRHDDAQARENSLEPALVGNIDEIVSGFLQVRASHVHRRIEAKEPVNELDHDARDRAPLGGHAHEIRAIALERQGPTDAHDGRELDVGALVAGTIYARELILYPGGKRHSSLPPYQPKVTVGRDSAITLSLKVVRRRVCDGHRAMLPARATHSNGEL